LNGQTIIDHWTAHATSRRTSASINLVRGTQYDLVVEYYETTGTATAKLMWSYPGRAESTIPMAQLYSGTTAAVNAPAYLSDMTATSSTNLVGPVERDRSNGNSARNDGRTLTINGVQYAKGLGVHAQSEVVYALGGRYKTFFADLGVDDEVGDQGSVVFQVWLDGKLIFTSPMLYGRDPALPVAVDVDGGSQLKLVVDGGDGALDDHADWAGARVSTQAVSVFTAEPAGGVLPPAAPAAPTGLSAWPGNRQVSLSWNPVSQATAYNVYRGTQGTVSSSPVTTTSSAAFTDVNVTNGTAYTYRVAAVSGNLIGVQSSPVTAQPAAPPLATPSGLSGVLSGGGVNLQWSAVSGAQGYNLYRSNASGQQGTLIAAAIASTQFRDTAISSGATYYYSIAAMNADTASSPSAQIAVVIPAVPAAPTGLSGQPGDGQVSLSWNPVPGAQSYRIYRNEAAGQAAILLNEVAGTSYVDSGLTNARTYYYRVAAWNGQALGNMTAEISATPAAGRAITDFRINLSGPHHVVQGYSMLMAAVGEVLAGADDEMVTPSVTGLPAGATVTFVNLIKFCCGDKLYRAGQHNPILIHAAPNTPVGTHTLTITYTTDGNLKKSANYQLIVDPVPAALPVSPRPPSLALASVPVWLNNMRYHGLQHCKPEETALWEGFAWYYDGQRVYDQIAEITGDPQFRQCSDMFGTAYRDYVMNTQGGVPLWRMFPHGLARHYQRTGDQQSLKAVELMAHAGLSTDITIAMGANWGREAAYYLNTLLQYRAISGVSDPAIPDLVNIMLGHMEALFVTREAVVQPFMVGLEAEALIDYWSISRDPRIPAVLKQAADGIWDDSWNVANSCLVYRDPSGDSCPQDLHMLVAPMYAWLFSLTHDVTYRDRGDTMFTSGVFGAWLDGGKQFSQNYRWSPMYLVWREQ
jgi:fibronectin type 3 domain-containing protein